MKKVCNWVFGSFFRSFGRVLVYLLFGYFISCLLQYVDIDISKLITLNVDAKMISFDSSNFSVNNTSVPLSFGTNANDGYNFNFSLMENINYTGGEPYPYIILQLCSTAYSSGITFTRPYSSGQNCSNSCFDQSLTYFTTNESCPVSTYTGRRFYVVASVHKWQIGSSGSPYYQLVDTIRLNSNLSYYGVHNLEKVYMSDDNMSQQYQQSITNNAINSNTEAINSVNNSQQETNDLIKNDNTSEAENKAADFFTNFTTDNHGLTGIITAPLNAIQSLSSATCSPLELPLPFVNDTLTLPCMRPIYEEHFGSFMDIYDIITLGIISYWVMVRIFSLVKDFKNPEHDEIEVVDL